MVVVRGVTDRVFSSVLLPTLKSKLSKFDEFCVKCSDANADKEGLDEVSLEFGKFKLGIWNCSPSDKFPRFGIWKSWLVEFIFTTIDAF